MIKAILAITLLSVVSTFAQTPSACCSPDQWQAYDFDWDPERDFRAGLNISYDATNQQIAVGLSEAHGPERSRTYDIISIWSTKKSYIYDYHKKECFTTEITEEFPKQCVPTNAKFLNSATIGITLNVNVFGFQQNDTYIFSTVTADTCVPVTTTTIRSDNGRGEPDVSTQNIWDVTPGIANTSVFDIPSSCAQATPINFMNNLHTMANIFGEVRPSLIHALFAKF